jgi:hypothetical protein
VTTEEAISLIGVVMEALVHRETCLKGAQSDLPMDSLTAALVALENDGRDTSETRQWLLRHGVQVLIAKRTSYCRRANNQKSEEVERSIRDLLDCGHTKTAISKLLKVNRRVVIRVAREAESAQASKDSTSNDLGKSRS